MQLFTIAPKPFVEKVILECDCIRYTLQASNHAKTENPPQPNDKRRESSAFSLNDSYLEFECTVSHEVGAHTL